MSFVGAVTAQSAAQRLRAIRLSRPALILLAALWLASFGNLPFWQALWRSEGGWSPDNLLFLLSVPIAALAWIHVLLLALAWGRATPIVLGSVLVASAAASYFAETYGVLLDASMMANIAQTHAAEAWDLVNWSTIGWVALFGGVPAAVIASVPPAGDSPLRELGRKSVHALAALACLVSVLMLNYQHYASTLRNHRELRLMLVPHNIVAALHGYLSHRFATPHALESIGLDARRTGGGATGKPMLTVLVIGETARTANFSLNGYARATNPELARHNALSFTSVTACGTSTAVSLPCMFASLGRAHYHDGLASRRENLLDVLQHAGISVLWRDNNSGCKGICERVPHERLTAGTSPEWCHDGECYDGILLHGLQEYIDGLRDDGVIVLHMIGSHGPAYFRRYPPGAEVFSPACRTTELSRCSRESIVNAYDNSIRFTDHVLGDIIRLLRNNPRFDTAMLYISDHGESLGENGIYLHGLPYALAPREQVAVPMVAWLSEGMYGRLGLDRHCLAAHRDDALSHDNFFHSVLGLAGVQTAVYDPDRDLFHSCRA